MEEFVIVTYKLKCIKETDNFTINKIYKLLGCAAEYVQVKGDDGKEQVLYEGYFQLIKISNFFRREYL